MQRYIFYFVIPNFWVTFFFSKKWIFLSWWTWWESNPRPNYHPIRDYTSFSIFGKRFSSSERFICVAVTGGWLERSSWPPPHFEKTRKTNVQVKTCPPLGPPHFEKTRKTNYQDVLFLRAWSLGSRLGCDSHCISRREIYLAVYIFSLFLVYAHCLSLTKRIAVYSVSSPFA